MNSSKENLITPLQPVEVDSSESQKPANTMTPMAFYMIPKKKDEYKTAKTIACMLGCACGLSTVIVTGILPLFS